MNTSQAGGELLFRPPIQFRGLPFPLRPKTTDPIQVFLIAEMGSIHPVARGAPGTFTKTDEASIGAWSENAKPRRIRDVAAT